MILIFPIRKVRIRHQIRVESFRPVVTPNGHQPVRVLVWQRPQQHHVDDAENRGGQPDSESQHQYRGERKPRTLDEHPQTETHIPQPFFQPSPAPRLPAALSQIHRVPKLPVSRKARLPLLHSLRNQLLLLQLPVQPHLLLQLPRKLPPPHQHKNPPPHLPNPAHNLTASALFRLFVTSLSHYVITSSLSPLCSVLGDLCVKPFPLFTPSVSPDQSPESPAQIASSPPRAASSPPPSTGNTALADSPPSTPTPPSPTP